jgi:hypothetical protein
VRRALLDEADACGFGLFVASTICGGSTHEDLHRRSICDRGRPAR